MAVTSLPRRARQRLAVRSFERRGRVPWTPGYGAYRDTFISSVLDDAELLGRFRDGSELPPSYGVGIDERCVEIPWLVARLGARPGRLLDAGSTLNHANLVARRELQARDLHVLTLAPEHQAFWQLGISYLYADLREIPIRDGYYDEIVCASTLEHVGADNAVYVAGKRSFEAGNGGPDAAMRELARVLKPGGRLLVTVPFGRREKHGTFVQFDSELLAGLTGAFPGAVEAATFYRYSAAGWQRAEEPACSDAEYAAETARATAEGRTPDPARLADDRAAAARAVACLELRT